MKNLRYSEESDHNINQYNVKDVLPFFDYFIFNEGNCESVANIISNCNRGRWRTGNAGYHPIYSARIRFLTVHIQKYVKQMINNSAI